MSVMDIFYCVLMIGALIGIYALIMRWEKRDKNKWKQKAANLLLTSDPDPGELRKTIKSLRLYAGRFRKDKEVIKLVTDLQDRHGHLL